MGEYKEDRGVEVVVVVVVLEEDEEREGEVRVREEVQERKEREAKEFVWRRSWGAKIYTELSIESIRV